MRFQTKDIELVWRKVLYTDVTLTGSSFNEKVHFQAFLAAEMQQADLNWISKTFQQQLFPLPILYWANNRNPIKPISFLFQHIPYFVFSAKYI